MNPRLIVVSPGPGRPEATGRCREVMRAFQGMIPIFGICLGMQTIAHNFGARVVQAAVPVHGKVSSISHCGSGIFKGLPNPMRVTRYHSLVVDKSTLPDCIEAIAKSATGEIMALSHRSLPIWGVQFHPEALLTEYGLELISNVLEESKRFIGGKNEY